MQSQPVVNERVRIVLDKRPNPSGRYVLYWMIAQRRTRANAALARAVAWAEDLGKPLLILEALGLSYEFASERLHAFVIDGMRDNAAACAREGVRYLSYVEPEVGAGRGLLSALAEHAALVVTDDHPVHPFPKLVARAAQRLTCRLESIDGCGLFPIRSTPRLFTTAYSFRRYLQKSLPAYLERLPEDSVLQRLDGRSMASVPSSVLARWPELRAQPPSDLAALPVDHSVRRAGVHGGPEAGGMRMRSFLTSGLPRYVEERNHPDAEGQSSLSPYLHFGHVGAGELFRALADAESWSVDSLDTVANGRRSGWWGMSEAAEAFVDQFVTWRELGFNTCVHLPDTYASMDSLPDFAQRTLAKHSADVRPQLYSLAALEAAQTGDPVWNAAQRQLVREGTIHNYLRMNWGKRVLEWSETPEEALAHMIYLNDKWALDGRDPNSYSGILWCLGRNDRAWGPERPIFGSVRYMTSQNTRRKVKMKAYLERFGSETTLPGLER